MGVAAYDEIATWYEEEFLGSRSADVSGGIGRTLADLLGEGSGTCLDIGCGTGAYAALLGIRCRSPRAGPWPARS